MYDPDHFEDIRRIYSDDYYVFTEISINFATSLIILYQTGAIYYLADVGFEAEPFENEDQSQQFLLAMNTSAKFAMKSE